MITLVPKITRFTCAIYPYHIVDVHVADFFSCITIFNTFRSANIYYSDSKTIYLCRLRSIAAHRDHFVRRMYVSARLSICDLSGIVTLSW